MAPPDIHIRRCDVRLVRSTADGAGLVDRADHLALARRMQPLVMAMIEQFLADRLAREDSEGEIARLEVELALPAHALQGPLPLARTAIRERVEAAFGLAITRARERGDIVPARENAPLPAPEPAAAPQPADRAGPDILSHIVRWSARRQLAIRLALLGLPALAQLFRRIHHALLELAPRAASDQLLEGSSSLRPAHTQDTGDRETALREWIVRVAALLSQSAEERTSGGAAARHARLLGEAQALASAVAALPGAAAMDEADGGRGGLLEDAGSGGTIGRSEDRRRAASTERSSGGKDCGPDEHLDFASAPEGRYEVACALPFLVFLRLAAHDVVFDLSRDAPANAALAYAIALKLHPPPASGRPWSAEASCAAALAAGLAQAPKGSALIEAAGRGQVAFELAVAGLNAAMRPAFVDLAALPLVDASGAGILFDPTGYYPAGGVPLASLPQVLGGEHTLLVLPAGDAAGLGACRRAGLMAACEGEPAAGEDHVVLAGPRGWRGLANCPPHELASRRGMLPHLARQAGHALVIWQSLTARRPLAAAAAEAQIAPLDRVAALLAGFALADLAYRLSNHDAQGWCDPDPLLALERFGDLSARVDVSAGEVAVTLPLGARSADLDAAGLLDPAPRLAWWGGRTLRVGRG